MEHNHYKSPLAIAGFVLIACGGLLIGIMYLLDAEPTKTFYSFFGIGLGFLALNPFIIKIKNSLLWQGLIIGSAVTSLLWLLL
jgi:hypothetical protein